MVLSANYQFGFNLSEIRAVCVVSSLTVQSLTLSQTLQVNSKVFIIESCKQYIQYINFF